MPQKSWVMFGRNDALPCPKCGAHGDDLDFLANVVECIECDYHGPAQDGPEFMTDWREAINDWNIAAGGIDHHGRTQSQLRDQGLLPDQQKV